MRLGGRWVGVPSHSFFLKVTATWVNARCAPASGLPWLPCAAPCSQLSGRRRTGPRWAGRRPAGRRQLEDEADRAPGRSSPGSRLPPIPPDDKQRVSWPHKLQSQHMRPRPWCCRGRQTPPAGASAAGAPCTPRQPPPPGPAYSFLLALRWSLGGHRAAPNI